MSDSPDDPFLPFLQETVDFFDQADETMGSGLGANLGSLKSGVSVVVLETQESEFVFVGHEPETALEQLNDWVAENWSDYIDDIDLPEDRSEARQKFFETLQGTDLPRFGHHDNVPIHFGDMSET